jgi:mono/diheme cytochrome c family protein
MPGFGSRLFAIGLAAIIALDVARSYLVRTLATAPAGAAAEAGAAFVWPPGSDLAADVPVGQRVYARHCAICHGVDGKGDGPAASSLHPKPRDFSGGIFKFKSVKGSVAPRLEDVRRSIRQGIAGTSMPAWHDLLTTDEVDAVSEYVLQLGPHERWSAGEAETVLDDEVIKAASAERGQQGYRQLGCPVCHGEQGRGDGFAAAELRDVWKQPIAARDLTAPWTYRWGTDRETVYRWLANGISGTPMPGYIEVSDPGQLADVAAFLESSARLPPWQQKQVVSSVVDDPVKRGRYLVRAGMCGLCHTPFDAGGIYQAGARELAGGVKIDAGAHGVYFSANLTPDEETGLGARSIEEIATAIRTGHTRQQRLNYWAMPWMVYGLLTADDAGAIAAYLKSRPPVRNAVPPPLFYGTLETVARKLFYPWPTSSPPTLAYASGNFARPEGQRSSQSLQSWLIRGQWAFAFVTLAGWLLSRRRGRGPRGHGGVPTTLALFLLIVAAAAAFVDRYPALTPMPAASMIGAFAQDIPAVGSERADAPSANRGRYLFAISSCAFCHGGGGSGGNKVSWSTFGTVWSANLTPHPTGLGEWTDEQILRVLRSGVRRDGRPLHWRAMPWDYFSNFEEEDLRNLLAFMRLLPAIERSLPGVAGPGRGDCSSNTFWLRDSDLEAGCEH